MEGWEGRFWVERLVSIVNRQQGTGHIDLIDKVFLQTECDFAIN